MNKRLMEYIGLSGVMGWTNLATEATDFEDSLMKLAKVYAIPATVARARFKHFCRVMPFSWRECYEAAMNPHWNAQAGRYMRGEIIE